MCPLGPAEEVVWEVNCAFMASEIDMRSSDLDLGLRGAFVDSDLTSSLSFTSWDLAASL